MTTTKPRATYRRNCDYCNDYGYVLINDGPERRECPECDYSRREESESSVEIREVRTGKGKAK